MKKFEVLERLKQESSAAAASLKSEAAAESATNNNNEEKKNDMDVDATTTASTTSTATAVAAATTSSTATATTTAKDDDGVLDQSLLKRLFNQTSLFNDVTLSVPESKYFNAEGNLQLELLIDELEVSGFFFCFVCFDFFFVTPFLGIRRQRGQQSF